MEGSRFGKAFIALALGYSGIVNSCVTLNSFQTHKGIESLVDSRVLVDDNLLEYSRYDGVGVKSLPLHSGERFSVNRFAQPLCNGLCILGKHSASFKLILDVGYILLRKSSVHFVDNVCEFPCTRVLVNLACEFVCKGICGEGVTDVFDGVCPTFFRLDVLCNGKLICSCSYRTESVKHTCGQSTEHTCICNLTPIDIICFLSRSNLHKHGGEYLLQSLFKTLGYHSCTELDCELCPGTIDSLGKALYGIVRPYTRYVAHLTKECTESNLGGSRKRTIGKCLPLTISEVEHLLLCTTKR